MAGASVAEVVNSVSTDAMAIQDAIGEKVDNPFLWNFLSTALQGLHLLYV